MPVSLTDSAQQAQDLVDPMLIEKTLLGLYPRLHLKRPQELLNALLASIAPETRRIVHLYCRDGLVTNWLSLHRPDIEIIGIDTDVEDIASARETVGKRNNLRFILANPSAMQEIPCDRILYSRPLSRIGNTMAFKKMFLKTNAWLVSEGDWIIEESLASGLCSPSLLKSSLQQGKSIFTLLQEALGQIGYAHTHKLSQDTFFGAQSQLALHAQVYNHSSVQDLLLGAQASHAFPGHKLTSYSSGLDEIFKPSKTDYHWELT